MDESMRYWFRARHRGLGWGFPTRWQGWLAYALYASSLVAAKVWLFNGTNRLPFVACVLASTAALFAIYWWKGPPLRWRWR